jgi:hypothetical protein
MSKKIDSFRRTISRETICSITERSDDVNHNDVKNNNNINNNDNSISNNNINVHQLNIMLRFPSPFKSFFIRMDSTGMLKSTRTNRRDLLRSQDIEKRIKDKESLFRSCSTSELNNSPTFVKGDDPSEGIDLQIATWKDKTVSCDDLATHRKDNSNLEESLKTCDSCASIYPLGRLMSFNTCDLEQTRDESLFIHKSSSYDLKEVKKSSFPYAFLRSKLSVLPEERHGSSVAKNERLFKTVSQKHFPSLQIEDSYIATTTLERKRPKIDNVTKSQKNITRPDQTFYAKFHRNFNRHEADRYNLNASSFERTETDFQQKSCYSLFDNSLLFLRKNTNFPQTNDSATRNKMDFTGRIESAILENCHADFDMMTSIHSNRRNSVSNCEQRLSSHYVSPNESGYDSDGPRGESTATLENKILSPKCSLDTNSIMNLEAEKLARHSTPSKCQNQDASVDPHIRKTRLHIDSHKNRLDVISQMSIQRIDDLRW